MDLNSIAPDRVSTPAKLFLTATALNGFGNGIINVVWQLYLTSLGFDGAAIGTIFMMNAIGASLLTIPSGILADRYGKGKIMLLGFSFAGLAIILILTVKGLEMLMFAFLLIGLSNATFVVLTPLYSSFFDKENMDKAFGLMGFLSIVTISIGSLMGFIPPMLAARHGFSLRSAY